MTTKEKKINKSKLLAIDGDYLLVLEKKTTKRKFSLPGGRIQKNESDCHALIRESFEEVGFFLKKEELNFLKTVCIEKKNKKITKNYFLLRANDLDAYNYESYKFDSVQWELWSDCLPYLDKEDMQIVKKYFTNKF